MARTVDFLQPDALQIRHEIRGILDSYNHDWDLLAELCQNAMDSVIRAEPTRGHIYLSVHAPSRTIQISDNGTGIHPDKLEKLLGPFATDKRASNNQVGQKGVGLTFVIFMSDVFEISSRHQDGDCQACVKNASSWLSHEDDSQLPLSIEDCKTNAGATGVDIKIVVNDPDHPIFLLSADQLMFVLRTRTALGNTDHIWGEEFNGDFELVHTDAGGKETRLESDCNYLLPIEGLPKQDFLTLTEWDEWRLESHDRSDSDKRRKLQNRVIVASGSEQKPGRTSRYWACLVPDRGTWKTITKNHRSLTVEEAEADQGAADDNPYVFGSGLYISTKGMPTGIRLDLPPRGSAGYMPQYFMIIEDPSLNFDIGRKYIPGRLQGSLKERAYEQFREYVNGVIKYISGSVDQNSRWDRDENFASIAALPDLNSDQTLFIKRPNGQEATVAAMFYELLGRGEVPNFRPLLTGYKGKYDLYGKWTKRNIVLEFKFDLSGLFKDTTDQRKLFDQIDVLVVWEITEKDILYVKRWGLGLEDIPTSTLNDASETFPLASKYLTLSGVSPIQIIVMKRIIKPTD